MTGGESSGYRHRIYDNVYVTHDGRVGIGTSRPSETLQVTGKATVQELTAQTITSETQTVTTEVKPGN